jgi:cytochrome c551
MFKRVVDAIEILAAACAVVFVVLLFVEKTPGTKSPVASTRVTVETGAGGTTGETLPAVDGAKVFSTNCAGCHGSDASGGIGPRLAGTVTKTFPDERVQVQVVTLGSGRMPAFGSRLSEAEIKAVVDYTRSLK